MTTSPPASETTAALAGWLGSLRGAPELRGLLEDVVPLGGGTQNVMLRFKVDDAFFVLRMPRSANARDTLRRELRVLGALDSTPVRHPDVLAVCDDPRVLGDTFYVMKDVPGFNAYIEVPEEHRSVATLRNVSLMLVDSLAALHAQDHHGVGLGDFGRPEGFLERQVPRWTAMAGRHDQVPGYDQRWARVLREIGSWLDRTRPKSFKAGIMHGDFHVGNVIVSPPADQIAAIVDWEMATIGDPLLDLGWLLAVWPEIPGEPDVIRSALSTAGELPPASDLVERYAARSQRDLSDLPWYVAMACFKYGVVLEGTVARARSGEATEEMGALGRDNSTRLFERALAIVENS